ncbi:BREX-1 system phosphatase PglZ type B [Sinorhizobium medicae]|uniref:BREX-1 system phosphatase PglZ type B n=1 Tax=Sinorhizobium medicae TaxID=110321 RepID=UPI0003FD0B1F|nr:BREX-1 system phosphatase PglZ type B [Sinorhizobium medicae]MDX0695437.1 BREX-1 system phosphatase PglZ type B [Sinorhizobium medicae]MDX0744959.1 BREX-1 system phosphatase PglZ type B [Sinorhizobium medicae]
MIRYAALMDGLAASLKDTAMSFESGAHWRAALLWPDPENQFTAVYDALRAGLGSRGLALYRLGDYDPVRATGPAIWLRCLLDATLDASPPAGAIPVFLLPSMSSAELKHPQTLPRLLRPLAELQYRGDIFRNRRQARDWTVGSFLRSSEQGIGLDVATDTRTDEAAADALSILLTYPLADFPSRRLTAEDFLRLIEPDDVRAVLAWIADPHAARAARTPEAWQSVCGLVKTTYGIDMNAKGARQIAVERLASGQGAWSKVLARVDEAPEQHRAVCEELRKAEQPMLPGISEPARGTSADNQLQEHLLAADLAQAADLPHQEAIARVLSLEDMHAPRRRMRWARLGEAPLARALGPLARLAAEVRTPLAGSDIPGLAQAYADTGYAADAALIDALAAAGPHANIIGRIARALYFPWADSLATRFREALEAGGAAAQAKPITITPGTCVLFVDGLRLDIGRRLLDRLAGSDSVGFSWRLAPVPTVTASAKPLVTPVADAIRGSGNSKQFLPLETSSGKPADTVCLVAAMRARGVEVVAKNEARGPSSGQSIGWTECGNLDKDGHAMGERLAGQVEGEIEAIAHRVQTLRQAGWQRVQVVTDHGWLIIPGGLPKAAIATSTLETTAWSRVALLSGGAAPEAATLPWTFDASVRIAVPPGVRAFRAGEAYAHGGVSLQECVVPEILVGDVPVSALGGGADVRIASFAWKRYRLTVTLTRDAPDHEVEVRRSERDQRSRVEAERVGGEGPTLELRVDPDLDEETSVVIVLLDTHGSVVDARKTAIGVN